MTGKREILKIAAYVLACCSILVSWEQSAFGKPKRPDGPLILTCFNLATGKTKWSIKFPTDQHPLEWEAYNEGMYVAFSTDRSAFELKTVAYFLDPVTGKILPPFYTGTHAEKAECFREQLGDEDFILPDGWQSHGLSQLPWNNLGSNTISFTRWGNGSWSLTLPEGAYNLTHWRDILIFKQNLKNGNFWDGTLFGRAFGTTNIVWEFRLPSDIPDQTYRSISDVFFAETQHARQFSYAVGEKEVYVFGNGFLFALEPKTGNVIYRFDVAHASSLSKYIGHFQNGELIDIGDKLLITGDGYLAAFEKDSKHKISLIRPDLSPINLLFVIRGNAYCFTEHP